MRKTFLLLLFICVTIYRMFAQEVVVVNGINYILDSSDNTAIVGQNPDAEGDIVIPQTITYKKIVYDVVEIGEGAFRGSKIDGSAYKRANCRITSIVLPEGIKTIGASAFRGCDQLFSITIPNSVKVIEEQAFAQSGLTQITFGTGLKKIGGNAFWRTKIKKITIPNSVITLGESIFQECKKLTTVFIGNGVKTIPRFAFSECTNLEEVHLGNHVQKLDDRSFGDCESLSEIVLPQSLLEINCAFYHCHSLVELRIPSSVKKLRDLTVSDCENFETLILSSPNTTYDTTYSGQQWVVRGCPNFKGIVVK